MHLVAATLRSLSRSYARLALSHLAAPTLSSRSRFIIEALYHDIDEELNLEFFDIDDDGD